MNSNELDKIIKQVAEHGKMDPPTHVWERLEIKKSNLYQVQPEEKTRWTKYFLGIAVSITLILAVSSLMIKAPNQTDIVPTVNKNYSVMELAHADDQIYSHQNVHGLYTAYNFLNINKKPIKQQIQLKQRISQ